MVWACCLLQEATCCLLLVMSRGEETMVWAWCLLQEATYCLLPVCQEQALTSTRGYLLPDFLNHYPYPTRKFLLPDRVDGSEEHPLFPIIDKSKEWKCNTFVMMDIFIIPRNENFTL